MPHTAQFVYFNDGDNEDVYATVVKDHGGGSLDLQPAGQTSIRSGVPHREKADYGPEGGGDTWHD